ncbi:MAG: hypothetical protein ABJC04_07595 [Verrucomicrobiota bacterium]
MSIIDLILNFAALLLWLKWLDRGSEISVAKISLLGTLKKARTRRARWPFLSGLLGILFLRIFFYGPLGSLSGWTPRLWFGVIPLSFRVDYPGQMALFSLGSFLATLIVFYFSLLLLSVLAGKNSEHDPARALVDAQLGKLSSLPGALKLFLPWVCFVALWCLVTRPLVALKILPHPVSFLHTLEQGAVTGLGVYLIWKYLLVAILLLHLLNSYIYFGNWPFWIFIDRCAKQATRCLSWIPLRMGKIDLAPVFLMAVILAGAEFGGRGLIWIFQRLPF